MTSIAQKTGDTGKLARLFDKTSSLHKGMESHKYIFVPYYCENHWVLLCVDVQALCFDSHCQSGTSVPDHVMQSLSLALTHWFPGREFSTQRASVPQQDIGYDCGVFMLHTMHEVCKMLRQGQNVDPDKFHWTQEKITEYRRQLPVLIVDRLLNGPPRPGRATVADEHEEIQAISPRTYKTYYKLIDRGGVRYRPVSQPYTCAIHERKPFVEQEYEALTKITYADDVMEKQRVIRVNALVNERQQIERHLM